MQNPTQQSLKITSQRTGQTGSSTQKSSLTQTDIDLVNNLFLSLQAIFPAWRQAFASNELFEEAKRQWLMGFIEQGISSQSLINNGLKRARASGSDFVPSVGKFALWCREGASIRAGLPSENMAFQTLMRIMGPRGEKRRWEDYHPAIYWAYTQIDWFSHEQEKDNGKGLRKEFSRAWGEAKKTIAQGGGFPLPPRTIEKMPAEKSRPETANLAMSKIQSILN